MKDQDFKLIIPGTKTLEFIRLNEIIRCEGLQNKTRIHLINSQSIMSSFNIGVFRNTLSKLKFYCTHKSHLINLNHIKRYHKAGHVEMIDNYLVPISRRKKENFQQNMLQSTELLTLTN